MLRIPWHRYITMWRLVNGPEYFPEAFERLTGGAAAVAEAEQLLAQTARARAEGRGIKPPPEETA